VKSKFFIAAGAQISHAYSIGEYEGLEWHQRRIFTRVRWLLACPPYNGRVRMATSYLRMLLSRIQKVCHFCAAQPNLICYYCRYCQPGPLDSA
jgi:hypothetical protein